ncbi:MAG TPA: hypothetical protein VGA56_06120 [Opitutaceae bacterium]
MTIDADPATDPATDTLTPVSEDPPPPPVPHRKRWYLRRPRRPSRPPSRRTTIITLSILVLALFFFGAWQPIRSDLARATEEIERLGERLSDVGSELIEVNSDLRMVRSDTSAAIDSLTYDSYANEDALRACLAGLFQEVIFLGYLGAEPEVPDNCKGVAERDFLFQGED